MLDINPIRQQIFNSFYRNKNISFKKDEINEPEQKKNNFPAMLLTAGAVGLGTLGYIKIKKSNNAFFKSSENTLKQAKERLKNIFEKDFTTKDAQRIIQKYQELNKISTNEEFYQKLFEQLKKDFEVENKNLALDLMEKPIPVQGGVYQGYTEALTRKIGITNFEDRINTIKNLFHEFRHVKQNELMYKTDPEQLVKIKVAELEKSNNASWQNILAESNGDKTKAREIVQNEVTQVYNKIWGHLRPISKSTKEYQLGIKYLENEGNRIPTGEDYYEQILEKEAQFVENNAEELFKLIKNL